MGGEVVRRGGRARGAMGLNEAGAAELYPLFLQRGRPWWASRFGTQGGCGVRRGSRPRGAVGCVAVLDPGGLWIARRHVSTPGTCLPPVLSPARHLRWVAVLVLLRVCLIPYPHVRTRVSFFHRALSPSVHQTHHRL